jgi:hypothetical protein
MNFDQLFNIFTDPNIISLTFKVLAIFFSLFYLLYAIVIAKQTQVMNEALQAKHSHIFFFISFLQIIVGIILLILAILLV